MTIQDVIKIAYEKFPERYEIVIGADMKASPQDLYEPIRRGYIYGYADAFGVNASHLTQIIWNYKHNRK